MTRILRIAFGTVAITTLVSGAAWAQAMIIPTNQDRRLSPEELEKRQQADEAYKEAIKKTPPVQQKNTDPWGSVRPAATDKTAKGR